MPGIKDVAKLAGVSYTTVSHVINKTRPVNIDTARKVEKAVKELNYIPNATARGLRAGKTRTIGVIDTNMFDMFFSEVMRSAQSELEASGYSLYFAYSHLEEGDCGENCFDFFASKEISYLEKLFSRDVDAIIINPINPDDVLRDFFKDLSIPVLLFQRDLNVGTTFPVMSDDYSGGYQALSHLTSLGHRDIAVVFGFSYPTHSVSRRRIGLEKAAADAGLSADDIQWRNGDYRMDRAYEQTVDLLRSDKRPSAIFYYSDTMAMAGLRAAADMNVSVPEELSIIGYDDIPLTSYSVPRLTSIRQDSCDLGRFIGEKAVSLIEKGEEEVKSGENLPVELIARESTGKCP